MVGHATRGLMDALGFSRSLNLLTFGGPLIPLGYRRKPYRLFGMHHRRCGVLSFVPGLPDKGSMLYEFLFWTASRVVPSSRANVVPPLVVMVCPSQPLLSTEIGTTPSSVRQTGRTLQLRGSTFAFWCDGIGQLSC
ncbi:hypothetical protein T07_2065 [Trichinella nelsoni]|uniref:Uncharacterized protein n=1 Tax=Trichinella nelsoni TaxID=6336 RepID=A0A0V0RFM9_9BILA|nr:hypothetical protein T07_2065 [Trichinella nelsoni]